jgi:hypothetical protein
VGGKDTGEGVRGDVELVRRPGRVGDVHVEDGRVGGEAVPDPGTDPRRGPGSQSVCADDVSRGELDALSPRGSRVDPDNPVGTAATEPGHRDAGPHLGSGGLCGIDEQGVQNVPSRGQQVIHPGAVLDPPGDLGVVPPEGDLADGRSPAREHGVDKAPAAQLDDPSTNEAMRGQHVAGKARPVDNGDIVAGTGEQHRRRGAGAARSDHDHVVVTPLRCAHDRQLSARFERESWRSRGGRVEAALTSDVMQPRCGGPRQSGE